ncbi:MAG: hypothetical protein ACT4TC_01800 [Myxococcaceae bacterium]
MPPQIEIAEVITFRLKLPRAELMELSGRLGPELALKVEAEGQRVTVAMESGPSYLRFRLAGVDAVLSEIAIAADDRGLFFHRVLGPLMVRHAGDLHVRLRWNTAERNSHGDHAEVRINRGFTTYPGLGPPPLPPRSAQASAQQDAAGSDGGDSPEQSGAEEEETEVVPPPEAQEIRRLVDKAKAHWEEYQRLKEKRKRRE